ncbi:MAG: hypothetical protein ACLQIB_53475 [Isosphaeraceae bacterium]
MKTARPISITVIAWYLLIAGILNLGLMVLFLGERAAQEAMARNLLPIPVQYVMGYAGTLVMIVCGIAMHSGRNWARFVLVVWGGVGGIVGIATSPEKQFMILSLAFFLIVASLLFSPKADQYFTVRQGEGARVDRA